MRGEANPLKSPGLAMRGSAQRNILLPLAHTPTHRLGDNLHTTLACRHPQSCVCDWFGFNPSGKGQLFEVWIFTFPNPMARIGNPPPASPSIVATSPHTSLCCVQVMVHAHTCREGLDLGNSSHSAPWPLRPEFALNPKLRCQGRPQVPPPCRRFWIGWYRDRHVGQVWGALREQRKGVAGVRRIQ